MVNVVRMVSKLLPGGVGTSMILLLFSLFHSGSADAARPVTNSRHMLPYSDDISMYEGRQTMSRDDSTYVTLYTLLLPQSTDTFQLINILTFPHEGEEKEYWLLSAPHAEIINRLQKLFKNSLPLLRHPDPCTAFVDTGIGACLCKNTQGSLFLILTLPDGGTDVQKSIDTMLLELPNPLVIACTVPSDK